MGQPPSNRIVGADWIRAFACLWVFACHLSVREPTLAGTDNPLLRFMAAGAMGVPIFFVLSGFLLSLPFWRALAKQGAMPSLRVYAVRRFARIVPEFYVCLLIIAMIAGAFGTKWGWVQVFGCLTFTNSLLPPTYTPTWNPPLWSIGIEMTFYVFLAFVAVGMFRLRKRNAVRLYIIALIGIIVAAQFVLIKSAPTIEQMVGNESLFSATSSSTTKNAVVLFAHFLIGVLAADAHQSIRPTHAKRFNRYDAAIIVILAIVVIPPMLATNLVNVGIMKYQWPTFAVLIAALLVFIPNSAVFSRWMENRFIHVTAALSYGIYIWHTPIMRGLKNVWPHGEHGEIQWIALYALVGLACSYGVAAISYTLIGRPVNQWFRSREKRARTAAEPKARLPQMV